MATDTMQAPAAVPAVETQEDLFTREELVQFDTDDTEAGKMIGKLLATLFVYTMLAMTGVIWWSTNVIYG